MIFRLALLSLTLLATLAPKLHADDVAYKEPENRQAYVLTQINVSKKDGELKGSFLAPCNTTYKGIALLSGTKATQNSYYVAATLQKKAASCTGWPKKQTVSLSFLPPHMQSKLVSMPLTIQKGVWQSHDVHNTAVSNKRGFAWQELQVVYKSKYRSPILLTPNYENETSVLRVSALLKKSVGKGRKQKHYLAKVPVSKLAKSRVLIGSQNVNADIPRSLQLFSTKIHPSMQRNSDGSVFTAVMPCGYIPLGVVQHQAPSRPGKSSYSAAGYKDHRVTSCPKDFDVYDIEMPMIAYKPAKMATFNPLSLPKKQNFKVFSPAKIKWQNKHIFGTQPAYSLAYKTYNTCEAPIGTLLSVDQGELLVGHVTQQSKRCKPKFKPAVHQLPQIWSSSWIGKAAGIVLGSS